MVRFLLPKGGLPKLYDDPNLRRVARCTYLAKAWKDSEAVYGGIFRRFDGDLRRELSERFDRFALLQRWNYQQPSACVFHIESYAATPERTAKVVEDRVLADFFAPEDFAAFVVAAAQRGDTMKQVLGLIREPPPKPDVDCIPFLGDHA